MGGSFVEERGVWTFLILSAASCQRIGGICCLLEQGRFVVERSQSRVGITDVMAVEKGGRGRAVFGVREGAYSWSVRGGAVRCSKLTSCCCCRMCN